MNNLNDELSADIDSFSFQLKGRVSNTNLIEFYKTTSVDVFIHLSSSEGGVPVSIQEAASFGIPIIATNAGGTSEIVNEKTGLLLENNIEIDEVVMLVKSFISERSGETGFRNAVRTFWLENFNAIDNYNSFVKLLLNKYQC